MIRRFYSPSKQPPKPRRTSLHAAAFLIAALLFFLAPSARAQETPPPDSAAAPPPARSVAVDSSEEKTGHTPRGALWRAAAVPGWGQFYNGQYLKMPVVYAGLGALLYTAFYTNDQYALYRDAYRYAQEPNTYPQNKGAYDQTAALRELTGNDGILQSRRQTFRRYRDLSIIGVGLFHALTVLDAFVSAHLLSFDVGEDLSARVVPGLDPDRGPTLTLRVQL